MSDMDTDYHPYLRRRLKDHRLIDEEIADGIDGKLTDILRYRERFWARGGWKQVSDYLEAWDHGTNSCPPLSWLE
jgi:hypothetical protein